MEVDGAVVARHVHLEIGPAGASRRPCQRHGGGRRAAARPPGRPGSMTPRIDDGYVPASSTTWRHRPDGAAHDTSVDGRGDVGLGEVAAQAVDERERVDVDARPRRPREPSDTRCHSPSGPVRYHAPSQTVTVSRSTPRAWLTTWARVFASFGRSVGLGARAVELDAGLRAAQEGARDVAVDGRLEVHRLGVDDRLEAPGEHLLRVGDLVGRHRRGERARRPRPRPRPCRGRARPRARRRPAAGRG